MLSPPSLYYSDSLIRPCLYSKYSHCRTSREIDTKMSLHTNYSQLYADASKNPFGAGEGRKEGMGHYINEWRSGNAPLDTATLTTNVLDQFTDHPVGGIGIFVTDAHNDVRLQVLLGLRKYTRNPSDLNSILFNQSFVYVNDVMEGIGSLVGFDASMLD